jgi:glutathione synthase/RimK-type ligase-like ATP-grasp enzyme
MILIITHKTDFTADFIINKLNKNNVPYKRFNCEDILDYPHTISFDKDFSYSLLGECNYKSVWFRRTKLPELNNIPTDRKLFLLTEIENFSKNLFSIIDSNWISNPYAVYQAENKLLQLKTAQEIGFILPATLVTNDKRKLISFFYDHKQNIIIKPIAQTRINHKNNASFIFTNKVNEDLINRIDEFDLTPCIFQENIEKDYELRLTVVGNDVFPAAVYSQTENETLTDWRRKKLSFSKIAIPDYIKELCIEIVRKLNLSFGAIDLIKTKSGQYVFLEINPNGQWVWIENETGQLISDAIIRLLKCGKN